MEVVVYTPNATSWGEVLWVMVIKLRDVIFG
jgi:hypothetical protein